MELTLHEFQATILRELLFHPGARFRDLNKVNVTNDHFTFHLNRLVNEGLITKENGLYTLTQTGKEFANRLDTESLKLERQGKIAVALHAVRQRKGTEEYLIHKRLKEPFYGWCGSNSGKVRWGETPLTAAKRELAEETGLSGDFTLKGIVHYHHYYKDGRLLEDKYFWVYRIGNLRGNLIEKVLEGENIWMTEENYKKQSNTFATYDEMVEVLDSPTLLYLERSKIVESY